MTYRLIAAFCLAVSINLHTSLPGLAQTPDQADRDGRRGRSRQEAAELVRRQDRQRSEIAREWASQRRIPQRIRQRNGQPVQLVGVYRGRPTYLTAFNVAAARATGTLYLHPGERLGLSLTGRDMLLGIWDGGHVLSSHQEFTGRVTTGDISTADDHATHVAGTLAASGVRAEARGMAYEGRLRSYDWSSDATEMEREARNGLLVSNHSYGEIAGWHYGDLEGTGVDRWYWIGDEEVSATEDFAFGRYGRESLLFDGVAYAEPFFLPVVAAGNDRGERGPTSGTYRGLNANGEWQTYDAARRPPPDGGVDGYDTISGMAVAKNVLTVGSIGTTSGSPSVSPFSSFGPVDDGRIKPDLVGYGERVLSSIATGTNQYGAYSGTSMATPNVAGSLLLLQQLHYDLFGRYMLASTLKALALQTATDLGTAGPDYRYGWGLLNAEAAAEQISEAAENPLAVYEGALANGDTFSHEASVFVEGPLRVTLAWTDPVDSYTSNELDDPTPHLRNDLDVRIINKATGAVYLPYRLDPANPSAAAVPGDNTVDPVEQVFLPVVPPGMYTIVVSHKGALAAGTDQPFSLIVTGAMDVARPVVIGPGDAETAVDAVYLTWRTLFERSSGSFRIERIRVTFEGKAKQYGEPVVVGHVSTGGSEAGRQYEFNDDQEILAGRYLYRIYYEGADGQYLASEIEVHVPPPETVGVLSNYPNPFSDRTTMVLDLPYAQQVRLEIFDALGRRVTRLTDGTLPAGRLEIEVDASGWAPGVYFARVTTYERLLTHQMILVR